MRRVIAGVATRGRMILIVRKKTVWILPGGKPMDTEDDVHCLKRELKEELPRFDYQPAHLLYHSVFGRAPHRGDMVVVTVFRVTATNQDIEPGAEIEESRWACLRTAEMLNLSAATERIVNLLVNDGYL